jgi:hypothetical protein
LVNLLEQCLDLGELFRFGSDHQVLAVGREAKVIPIQAAKLIDDRVGLSVLEREHAIFRSAGGQAGAQAEQE